MAKIIQKLIEIDDHAEYGDYIIPFSDRPTGLASDLTMGWTVKDIIYNDINSGGLSILLQKVE